MLFNSFGFLFLFLPATAIVYYLCARHLSPRLAQFWLLVASLVFYSSASLRYTLLLLGSILFNYACGRIIAASEKRRKTFLVAGLCINIALLAVFKYLNFILSGLTFWWKPAFALPNWAFPLGISFFTLQQVMYLIDCYERLVEPNDLLTHAVFVSFFPYVISGPITRARQVVPQIRRAIATDTEKITQALVLLAIGLSKKVILADTFSRVADAGFNATTALSTLEAWSSSIAYTFQLYFDFSGYTDLALGIALLLGFTLPVNFNTPYRSLSITEFWQRWHITLSQFITTYLYTPLIRLSKRVTLPKAALCTITAMTIVGLWHGPSWTFVVFGALHGVALAANQVWRKKIKINFPTPLAWIATFLFINAAFIFFRSSDVHSALLMCRALLPQRDLFGLSNLVEFTRIGELSVVALPVVIGVPAALLGDNSVTLSRAVKPTWCSAWSVAFLMLISLLYMNSHLARDFVYFKF